MSEIKVAEVNVIKSDSIRNGMDLQVTFDDGSDLVYYLTRNGESDKYDDIFKEWVMRHHE